MATSPTARPSSHSTTGATSGGWSTQRLAVTALFVALAMVASYVEIGVFPPAPYLKYDPSGVVQLVSGLAFGAGTGALVSVLSWLPHLFMDPFGGLMGILCALALTVPTALVYQKVRSRKGSVLGMLLGAVVTLVVAIVGNIIVTPMYSGVSTAEVIQMIVPILLPFNLIKIALNCVVTQLVYKPVSTLVGE